MKNLFTFLFLICFANIASAQLKERIIWRGKPLQTFIEWNVGIAYLGNNEFPYFFPGTSVLWGQTFTSNNIVLEYETGLALPTGMSGNLGMGLTGKFGLGLNFNNTSVIIGVRPYPSQLYIQSSFAVSKQGYYIVSVEYNPFDQDERSELSFYSLSIINLGYRWSIL